jgi:hypothetical protein
VIDFLLQEDGDFLLQENGDKIILEEGLNITTNVVIVQTVTFNACWVRSPSNTINVDQIISTAGSIWNRSASNSFVVTQDVISKKDINRSITHNLVVNQTVVTEVCRPVSVETTPVINQTVVTDHQICRIVLESFGINQTVELFTDFCADDSDEELATAQFQVQAPADLVQTITILPNPEEGDTKNIVPALNLRRAMDGTPHTTIKTNELHDLAYTFIMTREKALELEAFLDEYVGTKTKIINHRNETWVGYFQNDPFEFATESKDRVRIALQFRGERINA